MKTETPYRLAPSALVRFALLAVGVLSLGLGVLGMFLPLLPTTVFILLAAACFARASPRFHQGLLRSRLFGPAIRAWQAERALPRGVKPKALVVVTLTFVTSILVVRGLVLEIVLGSIGVALIVFLVRLPECDPPAESGWRDEVGAEA